MKFNYKISDGTFTDDAREMLTNIFGDYTFGSGSITDAGITPTHRHTGKSEIWAFNEGEDFSRWCSRCFPDDAVFEGIAE